MASLPRSWVALRIRSSSAAKSFACSPSVSSSFTSFSMAFLKSLIRYFMCPPNLRLHPLKSVRGLNPQISEHLAGVLEKALEMSINNRFSSAHSMLSALYLVDILTPTINTQQTSMILPSNSGVGQVINPVPARAPNFVMIIVGVVFGTFLLFFYCIFIPLLL